MPEPYPCYPFNPWFFSDFENRVVVSAEGMTPQYRNNYRRLLAELISLIADP
jgi:hypothetical protein